MAARQLSRLGQLDPKRTLFLLCDIQEKFRPGMPLFDKMVSNSKKLVRPLSLYHSTSIPALITPGQLRSSLANIWTSR